MVRCGLSVRDVRFSSFVRLCLLISDNLSDHTFVLLVAELIFILFRRAGQGAGQGKVCLY